MQVHKRLQACARVYLSAETRVYACSHVFVVLVCDCMCACMYACSMCSACSEGGQWRKNGEEMTEDEREREREREREILASPCE